MSRRLSVLIGLAVYLAHNAPPALAQTGLLERLTIERLAAVQPGTYLAGDRLKFDIQPTGGSFLLRFESNPEIFVLYSDRASLGSRILKYDSGEMAARVAGWGGLTLYTDSQPNGLPAVRIGDATLPSPSPLTVGEMENVATIESRHLASSRKLRVAFTADWSVLETSADLRAKALDAMENAARGLDRFARSASARGAISGHINTVTLATGVRPTISLRGKTLIVTFNPEHGYFGRASSRAIARALAVVLPVRKAS
ncbi:MAG TPA: DUF4908 domain-containing protein [Rhizomicrobium sp.]|nr:DUF4908 domain-containing protein [Rhizomicrobium sp.]